MAAILVTDARGNQTHFELPASAEHPFTIGTAADCSASLPRVIGLSGHHAHISHSEEGYIITAAANSRGILLDGERHEQLPLQPNTTYGIGNATFEFLPKSEDRDQYSSLLKQSDSPKWKIIAIDAGILLAAFGFGLLVRHIIALISG